MKYLKIYENFLSDPDIKNYLDQVRRTEFKPLTKELFDFIQEEGFFDDLENYYDNKYSISDFLYIDLKLTNLDKIGLKKFDDDIVNKFADFDYLLKKSADDKGEYTKICDFIDYEKGIVHIIKLK